MLDCNTTLYGHAYRNASEAWIWPQLICLRLNSCLNFVNYLSTRGLRWLVFFCYHLAEQVLIFFTCYRIAIQTYPLWSETSKSWKYLSIDWVNVLRKIAMFAIATKVRHEYCCWRLPPPLSPPTEDRLSCLSPSPAEHLWKVPNNLPFQSFFYGRGMWTWGTKSNINRVVLTVWQVPASSWKDSPPSHPCCS